MTLRIEVPLTRHKGHIFITLDGWDWLLDTGAPASFGKVGSFCIGDSDFTVPDSGMGLDAEQLSEFVHHPTAGIIGVDVLNRFNAVIDIKNERILFSIEAVPLDGTLVEIEDFMGIPIVPVRIGGCDRRMYFDTGAQVSYFQNELLDTFPVAGTFSDFYPGYGEFQTETYRVDAVIGKQTYKLRCGALPNALEDLLRATGAEGIIGNEILNNQILGYFPKSKRLVLA